MSSVEAGLIKALSASGIHLPDWWGWLAWIGVLAYVVTYTIRGRDWKALSWVTVIAIACVALGWWANNTPWDRYQRARAEYEKVDGNRAGEFVKLVESGRDTESAAVILAARLRRLKARVEELEKDPEVQERLWRGAHGLEPGGR